MSKNAGSTGRPQAIKKPGQSMSWRSVSITALVVVLAVLAPRVGASAAATTQMLRGAGETPAQLAREGALPAGLAAALRRQLRREHSGQSLLGQFAASAPATAWPRQAKLTASDGTSSQYFGEGVAVSGDTALVGAPDLFGGTGAAYVFVRSGSTWTQQAKLSASDSHNGDLFGNSVALSGDTALIGAIGNSEAYVFVRSGSTWTQQARMTASSGPSYNEFGWSVALSGNTALIGVQSSVGPPYVGEAYVFVRSGSTWTQQARLSDPAGYSSDYFGSSVALSGDTALVGAAFAGPDGTTYVYVRSGSSWSRQATLTAADGMPNAAFGGSVALSGTTALIGAEGQNHNIGAAYVFVRSGSTWTQQAELTARNSSGVAQFGLAVALSGGTALVGAPYSYNFVGAAFIFARSGSTWTQQARLMACPCYQNDQFAHAVALSGGTALVAGVDGKMTAIGAAYVFVRSGAAPASLGD